MKKTLLITGAAGYVGQMLVDRFANDEEIGTILALDKEPFPAFLSDHKNKDKIVYIQANTSDTTWQKTVSKYKPQVVIHCAWKIREIYSNRTLSYKWNIAGSDSIFNFCLENIFVERVIYFSSVASYGAFPENTLTYKYTEKEVLRESDYLYAEEKRVAEIHLQEKVGVKQERGKKIPSISVLRPVAITGPRGRNDHIRFGLQSALAGTIKNTALHKVVTSLLSFVPITPLWLRQYIHEDDIFSIVKLLSCGEKVVHEYEIFNLCPEGVLLGKDMAKALNKKAVLVYPSMVRAAFFLFWHITRGHIPTSRGSWRGYSYPIAVDGSKLTTMYNYAYTYNSIDALTKNEGYYAK